MADPYKEHWEKLAATEFEWSDDNEDLKTYCPRCGFLKLAHQGDECPKDEAEAEAILLGKAV